MGCKLLIQIFLRAFDTDVKCPLALISVLALQCSQVDTGGEALADTVLAPDTTDIWAGEYYAGDEGYVGIDLDLKPDQTFSAYSFSCGSDVFLKGTWSVAGDWIEFFPTETVVERGPEFSSLPRMKKMIFLDTWILLPEGNETLLVKDEYRINEVFTRGGVNERMEFYSEFFGY